MRLPLHKKALKHFNNIYSELKTTTTLEYICKEFSKTYKVNTLLVSNTGIVLSKINYNDVVQESENTIKTDLYAEYTVEDKLTDELFITIQQYTKENPLALNLLIKDLFDSDNANKISSIAIASITSDITANLNIAYLITYFEYRKWQKHDVTVLQLVAKCFKAIMEHTIETYDNQRKEIRDYLIKISTKGGDSWGRSGAFAVRDIKCISQLLSDYKEHGNMNLVRTITKHNTKSHSDHQKIWSKLQKQFPQHIKIGERTTDIIEIHPLIFEEVKKRMIEMKFSENQLNEWVRW